MRQHFSRRRNRRNIHAGMTLLELIIACGILMVLSSAALPLARVTVKRQREAELRRDLREMRDSIDRYKDAADKNLIRTEVASQGYPPDLETLMTGVTVSVGGTSQVGTSASTVANFSSTAQVGAASSPTTSTSSTPTKVRFLRKIPVDPMTGKAEWGLRAVQDDPDSHSWGGHNVFDVYSLSTDTAMDGTNYGDW
ncbi:MAG: ral secretion pathway protein [Candidatus Acidoferrum typicum]|jgi:general secretion pathway protein G|nr:ral secretion pathway protein [Candidatus Acidoferrum typicum]